MGNKREAKANRSRKKRHFCGNRYTNNTEGNSDTTVAEPYQCQSSSAKKLKRSFDAAFGAGSSSFMSASSAGDASLEPEEKSSEEEGVDGGYIMMDFSIMKIMLSSFSKCPQCSNSLDISNNLTKKKGLACCIVLSCSAAECGWNREFYSSKKIDRNHLSGPNPFDVNYRSVIAFREIGNGHSSLTKFCGLMNSPSPMCHTVYQKIKHEIGDAYKDSAEKSMKDAALEIKEINESYPESLFDIDVSGDGAWSRRGHVSLNGFVTIISKETGKCLDFRVLAKKCQTCQHWQKRKGTIEFENFMADHEPHCSLNHTGSSGSMETKGIVECFQASAVSRGLRYKRYIGDGDSSTYGSILKADPYEDMVVEKGECIGHVQKRMGSRLRKLKKSSNKNDIADKKSLGGKGRLTEKLINRIQNYYGLAIRQNLDSVYQMKKNIRAILLHSSECPSLDERHILCPRHELSWCKFQRDKITGLSTYKADQGLPKAVKDFIKPVFDDLSDETLLNKCLHGKTQNDNEALNGLVFQRCPKAIYTGRETLELAVCSAVLNFNDGLVGVLNVMNMLGIVPGRYTNNFVQANSMERVTLAEKKTSTETKNRRKYIRSVQKGFRDKEAEEEPSYGAGCF